MSSVTFLADDKSPLIHYDSGWAAGNSGDDNLADQYFRGTFQTSNATGGTATFSFNGTGFWIYGAKRTNHGTFTVTVDNQSFSNINGQSNVNLFQQVLFNQSGLAQGLHTVSLMNTGSGGTNYVDIDIVVWETEIDGELVTRTIDDTDAAFQYQEPAWNANPTNVNLFSNATGHSTSSYDAVTTLIFTAESVSIFGSVGPNNGPYSVSLDSGQANTFNATTYLTFYEVMLYHADNLGPGQHQLTLTNLPDSNGQTLDIDYAVLLASSSSSSSNSSGSTSGTSSSSDNAASTGLGSGAIVGIVIVAVIAVLALAAAFFFYRRWKSAQAASQDLYRVHTPQRPSGLANIGASSSVKTRSSASLIRNDISSPGTSRQSNQQPDYDHQIAQRTGHGRYVPSSSDSRIPTVDEAMISPIQPPVDESGNSRRPLPEAPGTQRNIFQQPVPNESLGISKASAAQHRASMQSTSASVNDLPPNYMQAIR
ncbi:hypothetical protein K503DRAFT_730129 [Rhizopogon vinicolor AM-OR11-026]|uniref:Uncharacterized protein n=1 Tax=Rhizopogon vinicolor AM-OR11-026 TaxID=1314800 RepID=A0A1B7NH36_9AGAM|nr:hypothetical protein K503DRAFT_730129 [Rhizopogon vinicolor AM-OR11-026]